MNEQLRTYAPADWFEHFFEGLSVELWLNAIPPAYSEQEADRVAAALAVPAGAEILDVPCGGGRLSLPLATRGYRVTGVDSSREFLAHASTLPGAEAVTWEQRDMRDLPWRARFDGAFCTGNSFGYLDDDGNAAFLRGMAAALKPGGRLSTTTRAAVWRSSTPSCGMAASRCGAARIAPTATRSWWICFARTASAR